MDNQGVGQLKKAAKKTQLKFRFTSLTANERLTAKRIKRITTLVVLVTAMMRPGLGALQLLPVMAVMLLRRRSQLLTNFTPLIHQPVVRTNISRFNFPTQLAWGRLRFKKKHLHALMEGFGIDDILYKSYNTII